MVLIMTGAACAVNLAAGVITAFLGIVLIILFLRFTQRRYTRIAAMSEQIDWMLHGFDTLIISNYNEGELSILHNQLQKVTIRLREQADNLERDKAFLSDSLADIAHQIRTPLTSINLLTTLLSREEVEPARRLELVRELETLLTRIDWLITTLLKISKIDAGTAIFKPADISVDRLINKALEPFMILLELRDITIEKSYGGNPLPHLTCDLAWTAEALGNIIKNCFEHVGNGDTIHITAESTPVFSRIVISDNGIGFAEEDLPHVFERFYRGQNAGSNSFGIGLALSQMIITQQNGTIKAQQNEVRGARFDIKFYTEQTL